MLETSGETLSHNLYMSPVIWALLGSTLGHDFRRRVYRVPASKNVFMEVVGIIQPPPLIIIESI